MEDAIKALETLIRFYDQREGDPVHQDDKLPPDLRLWKAHVDRQNQAKAEAWDTARAIIKAYRK